MNCKVIATSFFPRDSRKNAKWPNHNQDLEDPSNTLDMLKTLVETERETDSGSRLDVIIVNNDAGYKPGIEYLNSIHRTATCNGRILVTHRENTGRAFGAYAHAYHMFKSQYYYWMFSEDDILFSTAGYLNHYKGLLSTPGAGFVAAIGLGRKQEETTHAHGGCGLTTKDLIEETLPLEYDLLNTDSQAYKIRGQFPFYRNSGKAANKNTRLHCLFGEVPFTYSYKRLGYKIVTPKHPGNWFKFYDAAN